jgi:hypothetical protein
MGKVAPGIAEAGNEEQKNSAGKGSARTQSIEKKLRIAAPNPIL